MKLYPALNGLNDRRMNACARWMMLLAALFLAARQGAAAEPAAKSAPGKPLASKLLRVQYQIPDPSFCNAPVCADLDGDGRRDILFASRGTREIRMLSGHNGQLLWKTKLPGGQQSVMAQDLDGDGICEIIYSVYHPGRLYLLNVQGQLLKQWESEDFKLGNSPVIIDGDGDGVLDGYLGTRTKFLVRLNMQNFQLVSRRPNWLQCGCYTSAIDIDGDGRWDLFAGSGDESTAQGTLHRLDPVNLSSVWSYDVMDNASTADAVLVDIDGDGKIDILKSVDNQHARNKSHEGLYAIRTDGTLMWKVESISQMFSPNAADLDGDGSVEIVGMTGGGEVYCLDAQGNFKWRKDLRPDLEDRAMAYVAPMLCDVNGDRNLEIVAMTNGPNFSPTSAPEQPHGIVFILSPSGAILDKLDVGGPRYWNSVLYANVDDDPEMEIVAAGTGGLDVIQTRGFGPNTEVFQRRRTYQRLNVIPRAYQDNYFIYRGTRQNVVNLTDNLVLAKDGKAFQRQGSFTTELLTLPPEGIFSRIRFTVHTPARTALRVNILDESGRPILQDVTNGQPLQIRQPVRLYFQLSTTDPSVTPKLDFYNLAFERSKATRQQRN